METKKILPVYSQFPDSFWGYRLPTRFIGKKSTMPPTGLATVCALLPEGYEPLPIIDLNAYPNGLTDEKVEEADYIMTSSMIVQRVSHEAVVKKAHEHGKRVIAGGPYVSTYFDETEADYCLAGDAEVVLPPFLEELREGNPRKVWRESEIKGLEKSLLNREGRYNITGTPLPRWDLLDVNDYVSAAIQFSRGCPIQCEFCDIPPLYGVKSRTKSPDQMVREFDALHHRGFKGPVFIVDDNFIGNRASVKKLLPAITDWQKEHGHPFSLFTEASMNLAWEQNDEILYGMQEAGFNFVFLGIESTDPQVLTGMGKEINQRIGQLEAVRKIQEAGIEVSAGFIVGNDGEQERIYEDMFTFIQKAGIPVAMAGLLTAVKGTPLYRRLDREGRIIEETTGNNTHQQGRNFLPRPSDLGEELVVSNYRRLVEKLFDPKNYFDRCRTLQERLGPSKTIASAGTRELGALVRSMWHQLRRPGRKEYLKFLYQAARKGSREFGDAAIHAVKFAHFQDVTRKMLKQS